MERSRRARLPAAVDSNPTRLTSRAARLFEEEGMPVPAPPDQFQKKTYVRLPFADDYLRNEADPRLLAAIKRSFERPLLYVRISDAGAPAGDPEGPAGG